MKALITYLSTIALVISFNLSFAQVISGTSQPNSFSIGTKTISNVRDNIPVSGTVNTNTFAVIIANENYTNEVNVKFALNDGRTFKEYSEKTLGIPVNNIRYVENGTFGAMRSAINWITNVMDVYEGKASVLFYYAGHGMPRENDRTAYLLPVDGTSSDVETAIKLEYLYEKLSEFPSEKVIVFLDACFSGAIRDDGMLAHARAVRVRPRQEPLKGNLVVLSASTGEETAFPHLEKQHGMFTYFLLKKLQETKGDLTISDLSEYIIGNVRRQSVVINQKLQSPQVIVSRELEALWKELRLKQ